MARVVVVGAGIVGLAVAARLTTRGDEVVVLDKEPRLAAHQTGRNSGVVHSGLYYRPGSAKATMAVAGARSMLAYAAEHGIAHERCGKLVVATDEREVPGLRALAARALENGVPARLVSAAEAREREPHVRCVEALHVESTGIVDYPGVCVALAATVRERGEVRLGVRVLGARADDHGVSVETTDGTMRADALVACAGLQSDTIAAACGVDPQVRIVPFRGEYFELRPERSGLVRGLVYPVPDPDLPFLGVHLTRMVDGTVHAGPNAVLALAREGYRWRDVRPRELAATLAWPGLWRLGARHARPAVSETARSLSRRLFARSLARLVPEITTADLVPTHAGVRAQAIRRDGTMVDEFLVRSAPRQVHVLNAPSPAATCALEIAAEIVRRVDAAV